MNLRSLQKLAIALPCLVCAVFLVGCVDRVEISQRGAQHDYLFCFWNVENLFDDQLDGRESKGDKEFDTWFAQDPSALHLKLAHLSEALLRLNEGRGPDILAVVEVESKRAAELLREALNQRLNDPALAYQYVLMKDVNGGRHISPAIITRLPVHAERTRLHGSRLRILEGHIDVDGHDLVVLASHWTARITDEDGSHRAKYGDQLYGTYRAMHTNNPDVDVLICGDFNDPPDAPSVTEHLHAGGSRQAILSSRHDPQLLDLFAGKMEEEGLGTHYYKRWHLFDQIVIAPGLLDNQGWSCDPDSAQIVNNLVRPGDRHRRPWRFGNEHEKGERGYSDHFPVTVRLSVN
jgi:endonuclease/exonuclease/phosphatase family metal-dependent hydrolase